MPARPKTTDADILQAARTLLERDGRDGFSMNDVARSVGIRAPSLYKRFKDRADLLAALELQLWGDVGAMLGAQVVAGDPAATLKAQARAFRQFAKRNPNGYSLLFDVRSASAPAGASIRAAAVALLLPSLAVLAGDDRAFAAARVLVPFIHGFISMEIAEAFRLGGSLDEAFENGITTILQGIASRIDNQG